MYRLLEVGEVIEKGDEFWEGCGFGWKAATRTVGQVLAINTPVRRLVKPAVTPAASSVPDPGEGYRLVKNGEIIEKEDEWFENNQWRRNYATGYTYLIDTPLRRRVPQPDPGEGWRLLEVGETELAGDQYWGSGDGQKKWLNAHFGGSVYDEHDRKGQYFLRRRVAPVVSVGDRVKVLSGPWAGCTGVVIGSLPMNLKIKMDNVFVGGNNLTMIVGKTSSVELLPPVVPEVLYRDLAHGETVKAGDQFWTFGLGPWTDAGPEEIGNMISRFKARHRRPVRVQSPGWRYLDAGETVQAGDETEYSVPPIWRCASGCSSYLGRVFEGHDKFFRRKLPSNQGG